MQIKKISPARLHMDIILITKLTKPIPQGSHYRWCLLEIKWKMSGEKTETILVRGFFFNYHLSKSNNCRLTNQQQGIPSYRLCFIYRRGSVFFVSRTFCIDFIKAIFDFLAFPHINFADVCLFYRCPHWFSKFFGPSDSFFCLLFLFFVRYYILLFPSNRFILAFDKRAYKY